MVNSMTAFASVNGNEAGLTWAWEIRGVNGRGLDIRTRIADGFEGLEPALRKSIGAKCKRGTITVGLKVKRGSVVRGAQLNADAMERALAAVRTTSEAAAVEIAPLDVAAVLSLPGVYGMQDAEPDDLAAFAPKVQADLETAIASFCDARAGEGAALRGILTDQINEIERLCTAAAAVLEGRREHVAETLKINVARVLEQTDAIDDARIAQELALITVKADVAEELDRLGAHVTAAHELLAVDGPMGRKFDFLTQEFNREANTLCSKANYTTLTSIGLDLKTVIDQMREQVQNVE
ncbi:MAG: YicC family protein [Amylibacter sp.]|nr:YicC family protein [Amylibacter sp.]